MNNCESCGSALMPGAFFCGECGSSTRSRPNMNDSRPTDTREVQLDQNVALAPRPSQPQEGFVPRFSEESLSRDQVEEPDSRDAGHQVWSDAPGDETVVRVAPAKEPLLSFTISFANGDVIVVSSGGLIGRNPSAGPGEAHEHLVIVTDPDRTVSKTHLEFGIDAGEFWVADRFSGNGTTIFDTGKPPRRLVPGRKYQVGRGSRVGIGEQSFVVT